VAEFILAAGVEAELWAIWEHIADDNPDAATQVIEAAYETFNDAGRNARPRSAAEISQPAIKRHPFVAGVRF
jgi:plasmid stabilization system protein ParE